MHKGIVQQFHNTLTRALLLAFLGGLLLVPMVAEAAIDVKVIGGGGSEAQRQTVRINSQMRNYLQQLVAKEYNLDPQASAATLRRSIEKYNEMRRWLASGDSGNPFFVDNLELYKAGIRTETMNNVFREYEDSNICEPFRSTVITEMRNRYIAENLSSVTEKTTCSIEDDLAEAGGDMEQFFAQGGVEAIHQIGLNPENTPLGSYYENYDRAVGQADEAIENAMEGYRAGDGFKHIYRSGDDVRVCTRGVPGRGDVRGVRNRCLIATPSEAVRLRVAAMNDIEVAMITNGDELQENAIYQAIDTAVQQVQYTGLTGTARIAFTPPTTGPGTPPPVTPPDTPEPDGDPFPQIPDDPRTQLGGNFMSTLVGTLADTNSTSSGTSSDPIRPVIQRTITKLQYQLQTLDAINRSEATHAANVERYRQYQCYNWTFPIALGNERQLTTDEIADTMLSLKKLLVLFVAYHEHQDGSPTTAEIVELLDQLVNTETELPIGTDLSSLAAIQANFNQLLQLDVGIPNEIALADVIEKFNNYISGIIGGMNLQAQACDRLIEELRRQAEEEGEEENNDGGVGI